MRLSEHLVGRAEELGALDLLLARLDEGESAALEVRGEPGIGKTASSPSSRLVRTGVGTPCSTGEPPSSSGISRSRSSWTPSTSTFRRSTRVASTPWTTGCGWSSRLSSPRYSSTRNRQRAAMQEERYRTYRAVRALLELLARRQPMVLALDDVHWADPASAELLGTLLRRPPSAPVLMVLAARPRQRDRAALGDRRARAPFRHARANRAWPAEPRRGARARRWDRRRRGVWPALLRDRRRSVLPGAAGALREPGRLA